ncbi:MAG TPA: hypothetical protein VF723_11400 [Pyrinomonadaceae bacterium]|jgi:hypothetical protein
MQTPRISQLDANGTAELLACDSPMDDPHEHELEIASTTVIMPDGLAITIYEGARTDEEA